jgi:hypothetical protein
LNSVFLQGAASRTLFAATALACAAVAPLGAQGLPADSARAAADSLAARLRRAEAAIAQLQQQVADQASSGVTTRSRMQLEVNGRVLVHAFRNDANVNNVDDPQVVRAQPAPSPATSLGLAIRQTTLGLVVRSRDVLGGQFVGDLDVDFFGGQQPSSGGRTFPLVRIRTARGAVRWQDGEVMVGQESPLIAAVSPVSPAAIGTPAFAAAGNLWLWLPQLRVTLETSGPVRVALQGAVLANTTGDAQTPFDTDADAAERTGVPAFEMRLRARWGEDALASEVGCGGHIARLSSGTTMHATHALACDARVAVSRVELRAEGYSGRGLRGLGGGGISQNLDRFASPLRDTGGWAQLNVDAHALLKLGAGCGIDAPREADVPSGGRLRNTSCAGYTIVRPAGPVFIGAEFRRIETKYAQGAFANDHVNVSFGFEF